MAQPGLAEEEKWNWVLERSLGGFPAWEPSETSLWCARNYKKLEQL